MWRLALIMHTPGCRAWPRRNGSRRLPAGRCCAPTSRTAARWSAWPASTACPSGRCAAGWRLTAREGWPRSDRGPRRMPPELQLLIEGLALRRPPPTIATVHRQAAEVARAQGWPAPGYAAVYDVVQSIDPAMATLAHEGSKRYKEVFDLVHRREAAKPNEILLRCSPAHRPALPLDPVRMFLKGRALPARVHLGAVSCPGAALRPVATVPHRMASRSRPFGRASLSTVFPRRVCLPSGGAGTKPGRRAAEVHHAAPAAHPPRVAASRPERG